jgi:hypothetical protein
MRSVWLLALALALVAGVMARPRSAAVSAQQPQARVKWEYRVEFKIDIAKIAKPDSQKVEPEQFKKGLSSLGDEGWELVAIQGDDVFSTFYFRRMK